MNAAVDGEQPQSGTPAAPQPANSVNTGAQDALAQDTIAQFRDEIDYLDAEILRLVKRRAEISQQVGEARMASGGPRVVYNREMDVLARYRELGAEGRELAMILLRLGRGRLGY